MIELDDKSHHRPDRIKRDVFINRITVQTGLPLYRFPVHRSYNQTELVDMME